MRERPNSNGLGGGLAAVMMAMVTAGLLAACGGSPAAPATTTPPRSSPTAASPSAAPTGGIFVRPGDPGWIVYSDPLNGFSFQAPVWMDDGTSDAMGQDPLVRVQVYNPLVTTTTSQVLVTALQPGTTLPQFVARTVSRLDQIPGFRGVQERRRATLGGKPATLIDWSASSNGATLIEREYLVVLDGKGYVVSMDTTPTPRDADFHTFALMMDRFRFGVGP